MGYESLGSFARSRAPVPVDITEIPNGLAGTEAIISKMAECALSAYSDERVNQLARQVTIRCPSHDHLCEARTIAAWFHSNFRYTLLPIAKGGLQRLHTAGYTLFDAPARTGECASLSVAMAAMAMSLGIRTGFRTAGPDILSPDTFIHVYVVFDIPGYGIAVADPSYYAELDREHEDAVVKRDWWIT